MSDRSSFEGAHDFDVRRPGRSEGARHFNVRPPIPFEGARHLDVSPPSRFEGARHNVRHRSSPFEGDRHFDVSPPSRFEGARHFDVRPPSPSEGARHFDVRPPSPSEGAQHFDVSPPSRFEGARHFDVRPPSPSEGARHFDMRPPSPSDGARHFVAHPLSPFGGALHFDVRPPSPSEGARHFDGHPPSSFEGARHSDVNPSNRFEGAGHLDVHHPNLFEGAHHINIGGGTFIAAGTVINNTFVDNHLNEAERTSAIQLLQKPNSSPLFTGRKSILDILKNHFAPRIPGQPLTRRSFLLHGMGGIGKTQICLKFLEEMSDAFPHIFWIDASSIETITLSLKGISNDPVARLSGVDGSPEAVLQWIASLPEEWLVVFDNADGAPEVVENFIPPGLKGNILITSRNPSLGRLTQFENALEITDMEEEDAISLLLKASGSGNSSDKPNKLRQEPARKIVAELCRLPLAVDQAGAFIAAGLCQIDDYLHLYSRQRKQLLSHPSFSGASKYHRTVYGTWELSFKKIESRAKGHSESDPGEAQAAWSAILILQIFAFLHYDNINENIFRQAAKGWKTKKVDSEMTRLLHRDAKGVWDELDFRNGIQVLLSFSLIRQRLSGKVYSVHPLVHFWSRDRMSIPNQHVNFHKANTLLLCSVSFQKETQDYIFYRGLIPHIKANYQYGAQAGLEKTYNDDEYTKFGRVFWEIGNWKEAEELYVQVVETRKRVLGQEHPNTLISMAYLASTYKNQGQWKEAEKLEVQVMEMRKKVLGQEHPYTLTSMGNLGITYMNQGQWKEAEELQIQLIEMRKRVLGQEHPDTLTSMSNLAFTYWNQRQWKEAIDLMQHAANSSRKILGDSHPKTTFLANTLGQWVTEHGQSGVIIQKSEAVTRNHGCTVQ